MSLAGLDAPGVVGAHQATIAEPSGWFLLNYVTGTRDTVELLHRGSNGVSEVRSAVEEYSDESPLYGLIHFRRRKIVLKYVPDGTSRVLQVRLTVQFQAVLDAFTPHDTVFSFATAPELSEANLALTIMLLPSAGSPHPSSTSERRKLMGITEDVEDVPEKKESTVQAPTKATAPVEPVNDAPDELPASALRARALLSRCKDVDSSPEPSPPKQLISPQPTGSASFPRTESLAVTVPAPLATSSIEKDLPAIPDPSPTHSAVPVAPIEQSPIDGPPSTEPHPALTSAALASSRHLSSTDSDSIAEWTTNVASFNAIKPKKKKLGPRPHVDGPGRPRTSGNSEYQARIRPVANLPTSVKVTTPRPTTSASHRPGSQQSTRSLRARGQFPQTDSSIHIMPPLPSPTHLASMYRPTSRRSQAIPASITSESANTVPPEKLRLMKALQLRKRNQLMAQRASASTTVSTEAPSESMASINTSHHRAEPRDSRKLLSSSTASPTTLHLSEAQSQASSFTSQEDADKRRFSLSSDTSSSVTPRAGVDLEKKRKSPKESPPRSSSREKVEVQPEEKVEARPEHKVEVRSVHKETQQEKKPEAQPAGFVLTAAPTTPIAPASLNVETDSGLAISRGTSLSSTASRRKQGRPIPEHLTIVPSTDMAELSGEDYDTDELENATVHEAKPVQVTGTPVTPTLSKITMLRESGRSVSNPTQPRPVTQPKAQNVSSDSLDKPKSAGGRSISTALPHWPPQLSETSPLPLTTKSTVGNGISKRIKALEGFTTRQSTSPPRQPVKSEPATRSAFSKFLKRSSLMMDTHQAPNTSTEASPPKKVPSPLLEESPQVSQPWVQRQGSNTQVYHPTQRGQTVSVTARIIRNDEGIGPSETEYADINLYQSPLIVEHERPNDNQSIRGMSPARSPDKDPGRFSFSSQRLHTSDSLASKLSRTGVARRNLAKSTSDNSSIGDDKTKSSRAGRLIKRVSNLTTMRRNPKSPAIIKSPSSVSAFDGQQQPATIQERLEPDTIASVFESLMHVVDIGDVNVQFPESLLWKRRFIRIDDQGFLIFSPPANEANSRGVNRKFHLNDFRVPVVPDLEREEMAWSIVMDMKDGRSLQCACASRVGQVQVLQMLVDAHSAYQQLYGN